MFTGNKGGEGSRKDLNAPLLIFDSKDVVSDHPVKELKIYLHSTSLYDENIKSNPLFYQDHFGIRAEEMINISQYKK